jgi:hypothetical protein
MFFDAVADRAHRADPARRHSLDLQPRSRIVLEYIMFPNKVLGSSRGAQALTAGEMSFAEPTAKERRRRRGATHRAHP